MQTGYLVLPVLILLSLVLAACSASLPYAIDYPLTSELFYSRDTEFHGKVPEGWFVSPLDSLPMSYKVWLLRKDYSAAFHIEELHLDELSVKQVNAKGIILLGEISLAFHKGSSLPVNIVGQPREFKMRGIEFCSYELQDKDGMKRVVVFSNRGRFYECTVAALGSNWQPKSLKPLFSAQQTALASLMFK